jgi:hypothetical protein
MATDRLSRALGRDVRSDEAVFKDLKAITKGLKLLGFSPIFSTVCETICEL